MPSAVTFRIGTRWLGFRTADSRQGDRVIDNRAATAVYAPAPGSAATGYTGPVVQIFSACVGNRTLLGVGMTKSDPAAPRLRMECSRTSERLPFPWWARLGDLPEGWVGAVQSIGGCGPLGTSWFGPLGPDDRRVGRQLFLTWWLLGLPGLSNDIALAVAAVIMAVVAAPMSAWASRSADTRQHMSGTQDVVVVGDVPARAAGFMDRKEVLDSIKPVGTDAGPAVHCLIGQPGSGKSQAAAEWLRGQIAAGAQVVAWILAESEETIIEGLAALAAGVGVDWDGMSVTAQAVAARRWMESTGQAVAVVYDNVVDVPLVRRWLPAVGGANVLGLRCVGRGQDRGRLTGDAVVASSIPAACEVRVRRVPVPGRGDRGVVRWYLRYHLSYRYADDTAMLGCGFRFGVWSMCRRWLGSWIGWSGGPVGCFDRHAWLGLRRWLGWGGRLMLVGSSGVAASAWWT